MKSLPNQLQESVLRQVLKRLHYPLDVMLFCVRCYAAYALSVRNLEEMMLNVVYRLIILLCIVGR